MNPYLQENILSIVTGDNIDANISPTLRHSIFRDNNIKNMNLPDFFDYIVEYIESLE